MLFDKLFDFAGVAEALDPEDPLRKVSESVGPMFTYLVDVLRNPESFPDPHINRLMRLTWRLVGNRVIPASVMGGIPSLHFYYEAEGGSNPFGLFAAPMDWANQCIHNRVFCMGGLVWASSMARDSWNGRWLLGYPDQQKLRAEVVNIHHRAKAFESQFLHVMARHERFKANDYQRQVMDTYPDGIGSVSRINYVGKPFEFGGILDVDAS